MKNCQECGQRLFGREDKKFCGDGCRNSFNNKINKDRTNFMRNIDNKLRRNYRILAEINTKRKTKATRSKLISEGFDFNFYTNVWKTRAGNTYYFLYDQGYRLLENGGLMLTKKEFNQSP